MKAAEMTHCSWCGKKIPKTKEGGVPWNEKEFVCWACIEDLDKSRKDRYPYRAIDDPI